jgi:hypothetical protein
MRTESFKESLKKMKEMQKKGGPADYLGAQRKPMRHPASATVRMRPISGKSNFSHEKASQFTILDSHRIPEIMGSHKLLGTNPSKVSLQSRGSAKMR